MAFYDKFEELCKAKGLTPTRATRENGLAQSVISMWKTRGSTPQAATVQKLADYFGVTVDYLLGKDEKEKLDDHMTVEQKSQYNEIMELLKKVPKNKMDAVLAMLKALSDE